MTMKIAVRPELQDRTLVIGREFQELEAGGIAGREVFLERTRKVGALSPSGSWLVQNAADGEIALSPRQQQPAMSPETPICPYCLCEGDGDQVTVQQRQEEVLKSGGGAPQSGAGGSLQTWDAMQGPEF